MKSGTAIGTNLSWEETILRMQASGSYRELLRNTYLDSDLKGNATRYASSEEFREILKLLNQAGLNGRRLLDVGAGNGICSIAFAKSGWQVTALEPDDSPVTGRRAIQSLKNTCSVDTLTITGGTGELLPFDDASFDVVFVRQAFHHAADLQAFVRECLRVLVPGGVLLGIREHVILGPADKERFLSQHPMHKYYGGENAYRLEEYIDAFRSGGGHVQSVLRYFDSVINYFPLTEDEKKALPETHRLEQRKRLKQLLGPLASLTFVQNLYAAYVRWRVGGPFDERRLPGRMYSFVVRRSPTDR